MNVADLVYLRCLWLDYFVKGPQERAEEFVHQMVKLLEQSVYIALPKPGVQFQVTSGGLLLVDHNNYYSSTIVGL